MKKYILSIALLLCLIPGARADEGMWLIQCLDKALEKNMKARGLKLAAREIYNEEAGGLADAVVSLGFYCSGSMISNDGLLITNHHCAYSDVAGLSTPEHNYLENGFFALTREQEMPIKGLEFYFLNKVLDVTEEVKALQDSLRTQGVPFGGRRISAIMEKKYADASGLEAGLQGMWAGTAYYMCLYTKYTDIRLVAAPPVSIASFGGDEDNWEWPQHKGDFALYRIYHNGEPLHPKRHLSISRKGYREGDFAMVIGYPGRTARYSSAAEMEQTINVERPVSNRMRAAQMEIIRKWMDADPSVRMKYSEHFFSLSNVAENNEGEEACMHRFRVAERRRAWEQGLRAKPEDARLLDQLDAEYAAISHLEQQKVYFRESLVRGFTLSSLLLRIGNTAKDDLPRQKKMLAEGMAGKDPRVERDLLAFSVKEFLTHMDSCFLRPIHRELLERFGTDYDAMAHWLWENSCVSGKEVPIAEDPLYRYIRELGILEINQQEQHVATLTDLHREYVHARYRYLKDSGVAQYPDANSTMRLSYGRVRSMQPRDGVYTHWQSTARGLREKYNPARYDFAYPEAFREVLPPEGFPVNFITDNDITGGNSGSPVLNARGELIGLAFDGNKESLASNYEAVDGYNMCVCVDIRYVLWILEHYAHQDYIIKELGIS
jgi:hypothetical protein